MSHSTSWIEANQGYLAAALSRVKGWLEGHANPALPLAGRIETPWPSQAPPPALESLVTAFGLSPFERALLLLCAGAELDAAFSALVASAQGDPQRTSPTFGLALTVLPDAHWSALTPVAPLRYWRMLEVGQAPSLTASPLRLDERVLHYLAGLPYLDDRLSALLEPVAAELEPVPSQAALVNRLVDLWSTTGKPPVVQLCGPNPVEKRIIAAAACARLGLALYSLPVQLLPTDPRELEGLQRLWEREVILSQAALLLDADAYDSTDPGHERAVAWLVERLGGVLLLSSRERRPARSRPVVSFDVARPTSSEQRALWHKLLGPAAFHLNGQVDSLVAQFNLDASAVQTAWLSWQEVGNREQGIGSREQELGIRGQELEVRQQLPLTNEQLAINNEQLTTGNSRQSPFPDSTNSMNSTNPSTLPPFQSFGFAQDRPSTLPVFQPSTLPTSLWDACRSQARPRLDDLAQRISSPAGWDDLVLPELQLNTLRQIALHARQRAVVYERWGFAAKNSRGLGLSALFAGASGTGKTLAAEVLANELRLDLYRIDLSQVVSKYIGETEKNLRRVFDAAEAGGAVLLFDEADALFGKRSEVKDSHDRYANIEVSYLLQRMEAYRGLAILTTNMKSALDPAFLRRIRFVVHFPFPDAAQRAGIWRRIFPLETPTEGLDVARLARLNVAGGNIANIALNAAFLAADAGQPVRMPHLLRAAQLEYAKLEKSLTEAEVEGWH
jgi:hypothetical protein